VSNEIASDDVAAAQAPSDSPPFAPSTSTWKARGSSSDFAARVEKIKRST